MIKKMVLLVLLFSVFLFAQAQKIDVQHYRFSIELSDDNDAIQGKATIALKLLEDATSVDLDLASLQEDKGMVAYQVRAAGNLLRFQHKNNLLHIVLPQELKKGAALSLEVDYMGAPIDGLIISENKYGDRSFFADNWPNRAQHWLPCNDRPDDKASVEFIVTAPKHYQVIGNGLLQEEKTSGNKKITHWKETQPISTKIMVIGVARFAIKEYPRQPGAVPVSAWVFPQDSVKGFYDFEVANDALRFLSDYIAPFPYKKLANVQSKTIFGGMENASAIFYAENLVKGDRSGEATIVHEIAHQWFGDDASEKNFSHVWLSEGFATYFTNYYFEKKYGTDSLVKRLKSQQKKISALLKRRNTPVVDSTSELMDLLNANSYEKGGYVLYMLRKQVGDSIFQKIVRDYYQTYKGSNADTRDFQKIAERNSGKELQWFFDQWLYQPGLPQLKFETRVEGKDLKLKITQVGKPFIFHLPVLIETKEGSIEANLFVNKQVAEFEWRNFGAVFTKMNINPDASLLFEEQ